ncbi:MAG: preprotein translocase subunit YajC [Desulforegulaceae bacterium]|nr:preprotein translocase subunit YajC [Desulforegulaceae bacterium]
MISEVYAMGNAGSAGGAQGGLGAFVPLIIMFVIFYFLLIRPQQKKAKQHREMIENLKKGDRVITSGGLYGTISSLDETNVTLEVADQVKIKLVRGNIVSVLNKENA